MSEVERAATLAACEAACEGRAPRCRAVIFRQGRGECFLLDRRYDGPPRRPSSLLCALRTESHVFAPDTFYLH